jgi:hypothetical protein
MYIQATFMLFIKQHSLVLYSTNSHCANCKSAATASPSPSSPSVSSYSSAGPSVTSQISTLNRISDAPDNAQPGAHAQRCYTWLNRGRFSRRCLLARRTRVLRP